LHIQGEWESSQQQEVEPTPQRAVPKHSISKTLEQINIMDNMLYEGYTSREKEYVFI
jgi:hypothetical protein